MWKTIWEPGVESIPDRIDLDGKGYRLRKIFKQDFFATTALYENGSDRIVLKRSRNQAFCRIPMAWMGRWLTGHEITIYRRLENVSGIPALRANPDPYTLIHEYIEGQPLDPRLPVGDRFFDDLAELLDTLHTNKVVYVDANKADNIVVGRDGRPYLIDFQISFLADPSHSDRWGIVEKIFQRLRKEDFYHFLKHKNRCRPDLMTPGEKKRRYHRSGLIRLHRLLTRNLITIRRSILKKSIL